MIEASKENLEALGFTKKLLYDAYHEIHLKEEQWRDLELEDIVSELSFIGVDELTINIDGMDVGVNLIYLSDENECEEFDPGTFIEFFAHDLYEMVPTTLHEALIAKNIQVPLRNWISWG